MSSVTRISLMPGVDLTAVHTTKFKSSVFSMSLLAPLTRETAAANALIPFLLRRGTKAHPTLESLSAAMDQLYGGSIDAMVRTKGENQCIGFVGSFLDDAFTLDGSAILDDAVSLMAELLLDPVTEDGIFPQKYTEQEKVSQINRIRSEINDKRRYAARRVVQEMCREEPYGINRMGYEPDVAALTAQSLWDRYQALLETAPVELYYCGTAQPDRVADIFRRALSALPRTERTPLPPCVTVAPASEVIRVEEAMPVAQGKLSLGLRTGGITGASDEYAALILCNAVFGGTTTSKLFLNVREKLSLCYYASSLVHKYKGLIVVSSGVKFADAHRAEDEILRQLECCRRGEFEPWEIEGGKRSTISSLRTLMDSQGRQEDYWLGQGVNRLTESPEELAARVEAVTADRLVDAAKHLSLEAVYFLKGMEG